MNAKIGKVCLRGHYRWQVCRGAAGNTFLTCSACTRSQMRCGLFFGQSRPTWTWFLKAAPRVRIRFAPKREMDSSLLREGLIDLEIGKRGLSAPKCARTSSFAAAGNHVVASQLGEFSGPVDDALEELELRRAVRVVAPGIRMLCGSQAAPI
jgi:hypothetical protein